MIKLTSELVHGVFAKQSQDIKNALKLASTHDPDIMKWITELEYRLDIAERQLERLGAPQYRSSSRRKHLRVGEYLGHKR
jgi:hypothetical protein